MRDESRSSENDDGEAESDANPAGERRLAAFEEALVDEQVPLPSAAEWDAMGEGLRSATRPQSHVGRYAALSRLPGHWVVAAPLAAAFLLCWVTYLLISGQNADVEPADEFAQAVEIYEIPADSQVMVYYPETEGEAVMVFISELED